MDPNWPLLIFASIAKYFEDNLTIHLHMDGDERDTDDKNEWVEIYVDGPDVKEVQGGQFKIELSIHALVCVIPTDSRYRRHELSGTVQSLFTTIPLLNGDVQFGCLYLTREGRPITYLHLQPPEGSRIHQTHITAHYETFLEDT